MSEYASFVELYDSEYADRLGHRKDGFREIFRWLEMKKKHFYRVIETGTLRMADNWLGDGQSTLLFDRFVNYYDGCVFTVDINPSAFSTARSLTSSKTHCVCSDSVRFLNSLSNLGSDDIVDLLYLDSFDLDVNNPGPSMFHHIKELLAVGKLQSGTIIAVDDNLSHEGRPVGKGQMIDEYFANIGVEPVYKGYQIIWLAP